MAISFLGDFYVNNLICQKLSLSNFVINLEAPITNCGQPAVNKINLRMSKDLSFKKIFAKNPMAVNLANNHIMDFGTIGFYNTLEYLKENNIGFFGAGSEDDNFNNPFIYKEQQKEIALFSYCSPETNPSVVDDLVGCSVLDIQRIRDDISDYKNQVDFIIINLHWGDEEIPYPKPNDVDIARKCINMGAHLVIGHHAHVVQSFECYKSHYIYYGLGNIAFSDLDVPAIHDGNKFKKKYTKVMSKGNKQSVIVKMAANGAVSHLTTYFDGKCIFYKKIILSRWIPRNNFLYGAIKWGLLRKRMLIIFFNAPKRITFQHIKYFLGLK